MGRLQARLCKRSKQKQTGKVQCGSAAARHGGSCNAATRASAAAQTFAAAHNLWIGCSARGGGGGGGEGRGKAAAKSFATARASAAAKSFTAAHDIWIGCP